MSRDPYSPILSNSEAKELARTMKGHRSDWCDLDEVTAVVLVRFFPAPLLKVMVERALRETEDDYVVPIEVMNQVISEVTNAVLRGQDGRSQYEKVQESKGLSDAFLYLDLDSVAMMVRGEPMDEVLSYHHSAPEGYWQRVSEMAETILETEKVTLEDVYREIEKEFGWHPRNRRHQ